MVWNNPFRYGSQFRRPTANSRFRRLPPSCYQIESEQTAQERHVSFNEESKVRKATIKQTLTTVSFNSKSDRMNGHTYLLIVLGSLPPSKRERVVLFAGYVRMNESVHKKWTNLGLGGRTLWSSIILQAVTATCAATPKNARKRRSSGEPVSSFPSCRLARTITFCPVKYACSTVT